jgi:DNA-binding GntR family transcriptional regulator
VASQPLSSVDQHQALPDAIRSRGPSTASRALEAHVEDAREKVAAYFEELPI